MGSWVAPTVHATGDAFSVNDNNTIANDLTFLYQAPYAMYFGSAGTVATTSTLTQITLGGTTASNYGFSISGNNAIVPLTGIYSVQFAVSGAAAAGAVANEYASSIQLNGTQVISGIAPPTAVVNPTSGGSGLLKASAGSTVGLFLFQASGSTLTTSVGASGTYLHLFFMGSQ